MTRKRWFESQGGLRFQCTQCGKCCARPGFIAVYPDESVELADRYRKGATPRDLAGVLWTWDDAFGAWLIEVEEGQSCPYLVDEQCSVHDVKPRQCATYPFWEEIIGNRLTWAQEADHCEGIRADGDLYTPQLIELIEQERRLTFESEREG